MSADPAYLAKFERICGATAFERLRPGDRTFVRGQAVRYRLTQQELRQVVDIGLDLAMWGGEALHEVWPPAGPATADPRLDKKEALQQLSRRWSELKRAPNRYASDAPLPLSVAAVEPRVREKADLGLGYCPVASERTRCCNLLTLDAVDNCGYDCSYCSIQSFFTGNQVFFDRGFAEKLERLAIDPERTYHIGTGQSSDSLMWGNSHGVLEALINFAARHPNVILELKTKSANVGHLLKSDLPPNILCTWSLNTPAIVANEERGTPSLERRLDAAARIAGKGAVVGFHFHPIIHYAGWEEDYARLFERVQARFDPEQVAMVSIGTLTFIKPVMKRIRESGIRSQILKLPLVEAEGKLSYPDEIKLALFRHCYGAFSDTWKRSVFFYLCMEHQRFWRPVFGYEYDSNVRFEAAMKHSYLAKISLAETRRR